MNFKQLLNSDRRLVLLRVLNEDPGYSHNESVLQSALDMYGHKLSRDQVRTQLSWLEEQELITVEHVGELMVAKLTERGADAASGRATVPGIKRPRPKG